MFNPADLLESVTKKHKEMHKDDSKMKDVYLKELSHVDFSSPDAQNNVSEYINKVTGSMFSNNRKKYGK